jgi:hypothetical protein
MLKNASLIFCLLFSIYYSHGQQHNLNNHEANFKFAFYTQYNQFYIADKFSPKKTDDESFWSSLAYNDRLAIGDGILGIGTECYGPINGELNILSKANTNFNPNKFDHIVEGGVESKSGKIEILDCPNSKVELAIKVAPGNYLVRIYSSNLRSVKGDEGDDYYKIEIWPDNNLQRKVIKRYVRK